MSTTDGSEAILTPSTSTAPSVAGDARPKLPLAVRKNVRDEWEHKQQDLEERLSSILGTPWKAVVDPSLLFTFTSSDGYGSYPRERLGEMIAQYISTACDRLDEFIAKYPDGGVSALNKVAANHTLTILPSTDPDITYSGCAIKDGSLALLFNEKELGSNIYSAADLLDKAIDAAETSSPELLSNEEAETIGISFLARMSIKEHWASRASEITNKIREIVASPSLELIPSFAENFKKLNNYAVEQNLNRNYDFPRDWKQDYGKRVLEYFEGMADALTEQGFAGDDMLQEGFNEGVLKGQIGLRVVEKTKDGDKYNECVIEEGVLWMQTMAKNWAVNIRSPGQGVIDLL